MAEIAKYRLHHRKASSVSHPAFAVFGVVNQPLTDLSGIGLALTMVLSGTIAALSVRRVSRRWSGFGAFAHRAPGFSSSFIIICVGLYTAYLGWQGLVP